LTQFGSMIEEWLFSEYKREHEELCYNNKVDFFNRALSFLNRAMAQISQMEVPTWKIIKPL
jgi:hypothetical protein